MGFLLDSDINEIVETLGPTANEFAGSRILITGARGFLGRYFTEVFLKLNHTKFKNPCEIIALDNLVTSGVMGADIPKDRHYAYVNHDIIKPFTPERPVDFIIHAAGIASPFYYQKYPLQTLKVATTGLENMLELALNHSGVRLVFFSSSEIYGDPDAKHIPTKESYNGNVSSLGDRACYDESKRLGETLVKIYSGKGVHGTIIRPFNVIGPGMQKLDYRVLPNFGAKLCAGKDLEVYGAGSQTRTFCYVTDAIRGFLQVLVNGVSGEPYNIGNPNPEISMIDLANLSVKIFNGIEGVSPVSKVNVLNAHPSSYPSQEPIRRCPDITKAQIQVGYEPKVSLEEGLTRFFTWANDNYK